MGRRCTSCGKVFPDEELTEIDGMSYCEECLESLDLDEDGEGCESDPDEEPKLEPEPEPEPEPVVEESHDGDTVVIMYSPESEVERIPAVPVAEPEPEPVVEEESEPEDEDVPEDESEDEEESEEEPEPEPVEDPIETPKPTPFSEPEPEKKGLMHRFKRGESRPKREWRRRSKEPVDVEEVVADPDSFRARWDRAMLMNFHGHVILRTLERDERTGEFVRTSELIPKSELPEAAVPCTGEKRVYCIDKIKPSDWYYETHNNYEPDCYAA